MICRKIEVKDQHGLHLRPATMFATIAQRFDVEVTVEYNGKTVEGKNLLGLLQLEATKGSKISIWIDGEDENEAMENLLQLMNS